MYTQLGIQEMKKLYRQYCFVFEYSHLIKIGKPYVYTKKMVNIQNYAIAIFYAYSGSIEKLVKP